MKLLLFTCLLLATLPFNTVLGETLNTTNPNNTTITTPEKPDTSEKDTLVSELKTLQDEINLIQKKVKYLEGLRISSSMGGQSIQIDAATLGEIQSLHQHSEPGSIGRSAIPIQQTAHDAMREKTEAMSFMNRILKKVNIELQETIKDIVYLPIKPTQGSTGESTISTLVIFLTTQNYLLIYDINGNFLLAYKPGHQVKEVSTNPIADDYHIATLGTDNSIRVHSVNITRVKDEDPMDVYSTEQKPKPNKQEKAKFRLDCNLKVEYIYDLEHNSIVPESLFQEISDKREDKDFGSLSPIITRAQKYFACRKGDNTLVLIHRNGTFKGTIEFPNDKLVAFHRFFPQPLYATQKGVGLFNPTTLELVDPACDQPGENIIKLEVDQYSVHLFHVLTESGNILSYEFKQGTSQCKIVSRRSIGQSGDSYNVHSAKSFLFAQKDKKGIDITAYNITELQPTSMEQIDTYQISLYPFKTDQDKVVNGKYITTRSGFSSSFVGSYFEFENGTSFFTIYEMTIVSKPANDWLSNARLPIIVVAILLVVGYQFLMKKNAKPRQGYGRDDSHDHHTHARPGTAKARTRQSMEEMEKEYGSQDFDSLKKELERLQAAKASQGRKSRSDEYEDEYQEISTKKGR